MRNEEKELLEELRNVEENENNYSDDYEEEESGYFFPDFRKFLN